MKNKSMIRKEPAKCMLHFSAFMIFKIGQYIEERFSLHFADLPIKARHFGVLRVLSFETALSQQELCESLWIDRATMTGLIRELLKLKFIVRKNCPSDRRRQLVSLTGQGRKFYNQHLRAFERLESEILSILEPSEIKTVKRLFERVLMSIVES